jgi:hypothetical protein
MLMIELVSAIALLIKTLMVITVLMNVRQYCPQHIRKQQQISEEFGFDVMEQSQFYRACVLFLEDDALLVNQS